jgi:hypothetical protein
MPSYFNVPPRDSASIEIDLITRVEDWLNFYAQKIRERSLVVLIEITICEDQRVGISVSSEGANYEIRHDLKKGIVIDGPGKRKGDRSASEESLMAFWQAELVPRIRNFIHGGGLGCLSFRVSRETVYCERRESKQMDYTPPLVTTHRMY